MTDREKLIELMFSYQDEYNSIVVDKVGLAKHLIAHGVTVQKQGQWIDSLDKDGFLCNAWRKCSSCGCLNFSKKPPYCPNCGAKMDLEDNQ